MAFNNNNNKQEYSPVQVYSDYKMSNTNSPIKPSVMTHSFLRSQLVFTISPLKPSNDGSINWDYKNGLSIYITHKKAFMLAQELKAFKENKDLVCGVTSGNGCINIFKGTKYGVDSPVVVISKLDDKGAVMAEEIYHINMDYHYAIRNFEPNDFSFDKQFYNDLEIDQMIILLEEYYKAMTSAIAYSVLDKNKYNDTAAMNLLKATAAQVGVEIKSGGSNTGNSYKGSAFDSRQNSNGSNGVSNPYSQSSIEDIEKMMSES